MAKLEGEFLQELEVQEPVELVVTPGAGDVEVGAGLPGKVRVKGSFSLRATPRARAERLAQLLQDSPPVEVRGREVRVGELSKYAARVGPGLLGPLEGVWIDYQIEVPEVCEVNIKSGSGDIQIQGISGPAAVFTGSGDIELEGISGDVEVRAGSGDVQARKLGGELRVTTGSGDVSTLGVQDDLEIKTGSGDVKAQGISGDLRVTTGSGDLSLEGLAGDVEVKSGSGDIHVDSGIPEGKSWRLRTGSGDVELLLPREANFRLVAESDFGEVESDFPSASEAASSIEVKTGSGDIRIRARG